MLLLLVLTTYAFLTVVLYLSSTIRVEKKKSVVMNTNTLSNQWLDCQCTCSCGHDPCLEENNFGYCSTGCANSLDYYFVIIPEITGFTVTVRNIATCQLDGFMVSVDGITSGINEAELITEVESDPISLLIMYDEISHSTYGVHQYATNRWHVTDDYDGKTMATAFYHYSGDIDIFPESWKIMGRVGYDDVVMSLKIQLSVFYVRRWPVGTMPIGEQGKLNPVYEIVFYSDGESDPLNVLIQGYNKYVDDEMVPWIHWAVNVHLDNLMIEAYTELMSFNTMRISSVVYGNDDGYAMVHFRPWEHELSNFDIGVPIDDEYTLDVDFLEHGSVATTLTFVCAYGFDYSNPKPLTDDPPNLVTLESFTDEELTNPSNTFDADSLYPHYLEVVVPVPFKYYSLAQLMIKLLVGIDSEGAKKVFVLEGEDLEQMGGDYRFPSAENGFLARKLRFKRNPMTASRLEGIDIRSGKFLLNAHIIVGEKGGRRMLSNHFLASTELIGNVLPGDIPCDSFAECSVDALIIIGFGVCGFFFIIIAFVIIVLIMIYILKSRKQNDNKNVVVPESALTFENTNNFSKSQELIPKVQVTINNDEMKSMDNSETETVDRNRDQELMLFESRNLTSEKLEEIQENENIVY